MSTKAPTYYFDNNATTRIAPEVIEAMRPFFEEHWGNPSSPYSFGHELAGHIDQAREQVAALLGAEPREIVFTSCATESINTALNSAVVTQSGKRHLITTAVEHSATLKCCAMIEKRGYEVTYLPVASDGTLDTWELERAIRPDTALVSVMWANNETGVLFPMKEIGAICRDRGVLCHTDAVQMAGKLPVDVGSANVDFLSLSAHKLHGPKGIGLLYVKRDTRFQPYLAGGGQERGRRGGTENVPYIIGFGRAAELAMAGLTEQNTRVRRLRDRFEENVLRLISGTARNGAGEPRLPNTSNLAFEGVEAEGLLLLLDQVGIYVSSGSACTSGALDPSHVLLAMGLGARRARSSLRFSFGRYTTEQELDFLLQRLPATVRRLQELFSAPEGASARPASAQTRPGMRS